MAKRSLKTRLIAALLSPIVFLGLVEGVLRIAGWSWSPADQLAGQGQRDELTRPEIYTQHPRYLWTLNPNAEIDVPPAGMKEVRTNSRGLRGPELPYRKEPGEFRVLCFGDSVTFGLGLREDETVPAQIQAALAKNIEGACVINLGVPGWSSLQGRRLLEDVASLEPDAIVFWFGMNDAKEHMGTPDSLLRPAGSKTTSTAEASWFRRLRTVQLIRSFVVAFRRSALGETRVGTREYVESIDAFMAVGVPVIFVRYPERVKTTLDQLENVLEQARRAGVNRLVGPVPVLSAIVPAPADLDLLGTKVPSEGGPVLRLPGTGRMISKTVAGLAAEKERLACLFEHLVALLDRLPEGGPGYEELFGEAAPEEVFTDNCHLTPAGARRAGQALAERLAGFATSRR